MNRQHFITLDALRFLAFFKVFLLHVPIVSFEWFNYLRAGGGIGVSFFFTLSGFLITYILLAEKETNGTINLKTFYLKRILRIWPLFYAMLLFAFLTPYILSIIGIANSGEGYSPNWWMSFFFLENYQMMILDSFPNVSPLGVMWSLCIEEHYYVLWGLTLFFVKSKYIPHALVISIAVAFATRAWYNHIGWAHLDLFSNLHYFAYGAIPAYLFVLKKVKFVELIQQTSPLLKWSILVMTTACIVIIPNVDSINTSYLTPDILGILFSLTITILLPGIAPFKISNHHVLSKLGIYTYGLYLYHGIVLNFCLKLFGILQWDLTSVGNAIVFFSISLFASVLISIGSYYLFEIHFIRLKPKQT